MKIIEEEVKIWRSAVLRRKTSHVPYRLPWSTEIAYNAIIGAWMAEVESRGGTFRLLEDVNSEAKLVAEWLTSNSPKWGALLQGGVGNGKTTLLHALKDVISAKSTPVPGEVTGKYYSLKIVEAKKIQTREEVQELQSCILLALDDVGEEPLEILDFGNRITPIIDIISSRYNTQKTTIITTNLGNKDFREKYGARIADRINEMTVRIPFRGESFRPRCC